MSGILRVVHVTVGLGLGGAEKIMAELAVGVDRTRFQTEVLALKGWGPVGDRLKEAGVPVTALGGRGAWDARVLMKAGAFVRSRSPDIVHAHVLWAGLVASRVKGRAALVWHEHDSLVWMKAFHRFCHRRIVSRADRVIAVSRSVAQELSRAHPRLGPKVVVIPNALPSDGPPNLRDHPASVPAPWPAWLSGAPVVGWVGRMEEPKKGLAVLLSAAGIVFSKKPETRFVLVGDGPARRALERTVADREWGERVYFAGEQRKVGPFFERFDVLAIPSLWEGFGIVALEAMRAGKPVVASRVGGLSDVVVDGETGRLVPPGDPAALASALLGVLNEPREAGRMGETGRERVRTNFSMENYVKNVEKIYGEWWPTK